MKKKAMSPQPEFGATSKLKVPSLTPRNLVATNPLLKKSGAHQDKRRKTLLADADSQARSAKKQRRSTDDE